MNEIHKPEQQSDNPELKQKTPEALRENETRLQKCGLKLDGAAPELEFANSRDNEKHTEVAGFGEQDRRKAELENAIPVESNEGITGEEKYKCSFVLNLDGLRVVETKSPDVANAEWKARGYENPPYDPACEVKVVLPENKEFVRVYSYSSDGGNNKLGPWIMDKNDIKGLSSSEIKDAYALPKEPTHICDVKVPPNFELQTGIANRVESWGNGGKQQYDTLGKRLPSSSFVNERTIQDKES